MTLTRLPRDPYFVQFVRFLAYPWFKAPTAVEIAEFQDSISDPSVKAPRDISGLLLVGLPIVFFTLLFIAAVLMGVTV